MSKAPLHNKPFSVLLVEDDDVDIELVQRAFEKTGIDNKIIVARSGEQAFAILREEEEQERLEKPYIILLDLNMPIMNGHEFLKELRADPELKDAIVYILTTSDDQRARKSTGELAIAGYLLKSDISEGRWPW